MWSIIVSIIVIHVTCAHVLRVRAARSYHDAVLCLGEYFFSGHAVQCDGGDVCACMYHMYRRR
jgi:hypothetical protein